MKTSVRYPVTQGDVIVNYASSIFDRTELTTDKALPADVYCGDILDSKTFALYDSAAAVGEPVINLSDMSADGQNKTLVIVDRHVVITDHFLRAKDDASKKAALQALTASGSIRLAINADYFA